MQPNAMVKVLEAFFKVNSVHGSEDRSVVAASEALDVASLLSNLTGRIRPNFQGRATAPSHENL